MIAVRSARGHARTVDLLTDISSFQAARRHDGRCGQIEFSRARLSPGIRLSAGFAARSRMPGRRGHTAMSAQVRAGRGCPLPPNSLACGRCCVVRRWIARSIGARAKHASGRSGRQF